MAQSQLVTRYNINKILGKNSNNTKLENYNLGHNHPHNDSNIHSQIPIHNDTNKSLIENHQSFVHEELNRIEINNIICHAIDQGAKPYQEDSTFFFCSEDFSFMVAAIFDGHGGRNGRVASNVSSHVIEQYFKTNWKKCLQWKEEQWKQEFTSLFAVLHNKIRDTFITLEHARRKRNNEPLYNLCDEKGIVRTLANYPIHGGTTATIVCVIRTEKHWKIICSNVGDSDALLLAKKPELLPENNKKCKHLSVDHGPDNVSEYLRIKQLPTDKYPLKLLFIYDQNNVQHKSQCPLVFLEDGTKDPKYAKYPWNNELRPTNVRYDPAIYAVSPYGILHDVTCIAMTRSLGDFYSHQFGLSYIPDITFNEIEIDNHEYIITVGSDGIWDCWKWDEWSNYFNDLMTKNNNRLDIVVKTALQYTIKKAKACFGHTSYDDASLVCIALRPELFPSYKINIDNNNNDENKNINMDDNKNTDNKQKESHINNFIKNENENEDNKKNSSITLTCDSSNHTITTSDDITKSSSQKIVEGNLNDL